MDEIKNLPKIVKQGYYMVKLDIKKAYIHVLVDPQYRDLFRFLWQCAHYPPRIFTMLLRPVLTMLRGINVSVIAYLDDMLIIGSTKECFKLNLEKSVLEPTQSITFLRMQIDSLSMKLLVPKEKKKSVIKEIRNFLKLDCCSPRKLDGLKRNLIALKDAVIPFRLYTRCTNKFHSQCLTLANGGATLKKGNKIIKTWSFQWSNKPTKHVFKSSRNVCAVNGVSSTLLETEQLQTKDSNLQHYHSLIHQSPGWSYTRSIRSVRTTLEIMPQEENGSIRTSPGPSNDQIFNNQNECTLPHLESKETIPGIHTTKTLTFFPGEDALVQFDKGFYNTDISNVEISNMVSDDSSTSSSSSMSHVSSSYGPSLVHEIQVQMGLLMKSWRQSTLKVYNSSFTNFLNFCTLNSLDPSNISLVVFMDYLTYMFKIRPLNQADIVNDPFITRIMTGIHKLRPSYSKYKEIWDANKVFKYLSTIKILPKLTYTALLNKEQ
ncbi:hypothetical protein ACTFIZ_012325, partial [Dictyostelium cf. discoideum]